MPTSSASGDHEPVGERLEPDDVGGVVQEAAGDRHRPVAAAVVEQPAVAVVVGLAVVGERVGIGAGQLAEQPVERGRVAQLVLGERAHRDVLLEERRDPGPLRVGEADHELVVGHRAEQLRQRGGREGGRGGHFERAFGLAWPDCARAAASLSRIT